MSARVFNFLRLNGVPVFAYHGLSNATELSGSSKEKRYLLSTAQIREHLNAIRVASYKTTLLRDIWSSSGLAAEMRSKVTLTFDDGKASDYLVAFPLLQEFGASAEFFVNTATIGGENHTSWSQILEMQKYGMSFQSHGHDHVDMTRLTNATLDRQLKTSKGLLEDRLGRAVDFLAVPYGIYDRRLIRAAIEAGYRAVCTCHSWPARPGSQCVNRSVLLRETSDQDFRRLLTLEARVYLARFVRKPLALPGWLLGHFFPARSGIRLLEER